MSNQHLTFNNDQKVPNRLSILAYLRAADKLVTYLFTRLRPEYAVAFGQSDCACVGRLCFADRILFN